ncbi:MAG: hypothetical protein Q4F95_10070 [Oscillospiraceae bacterium]|nr:hypothetical protein [Oscillospiraceae bacterium]
MIRKNIIALLLVLSLAALCSCSSSAPSSVSESDSADVTTDINDYINEALKNKKNETDTQPEPPVTQEAEEGVDMDLTQLGDSMVYAQVYDLLSNADKYMGQTIKIRGRFQSVVSDETNLRYYYVMVSDTTACCQQGFEFIWGDNSHVYPDEYPQEDSEIVIKGVLGTYDEQDKTYCYLAVDDLNV